MIFQARHFRSNVTQMALTACALLAGACGSSGGGTGPGKADAAPPPPEADTGARPDPDATGTGGGAEGGTVRADGAAVPDGASAGDDGGAQGSDAQPYVRTDGGPFGIAARAPLQTCKPPARPDQPAQLLSATGCVDPAAPTHPAASLIPYDVNSPLWSDGADKQRFLALPDGALIHVKDCAREPALCKPTAEGGTTHDLGHFELPLGTVLVKSFLFNGKLLETRLFIHMSDMWHGYSYRWNDAQTDATLVGEYGQHQMISNGGAQQDWYFPSRTDCLECHNDTVGNSLGLETIQLDRMVRYPSGVTADQLATLEHIGILDAPVTRQPPLIDPRLPDPTGKNLEARVRSYLHANCAICHRPEGNYSAIDLRSGVSLADTNMCNIDPDKGDQGVIGSKRLDPARPANSVLLLRMKAADKMSGRMPQLASSVVDPTGVGLVTDWIKSITRCP
jgi:uncharacterized repeat protein (TIGR03806 family)